MYLNSVLLLVPVFSMAVSSAHTGQFYGSLRVMSYNVRFDSKPDNISVQETIASLPQQLPQRPPKYYADTSERPWSTRRIRVANDILLSNVDIYGGQELLRRQVTDLEELLGSDWAWIGRGRNDGKRKGEYTPIFYNKRNLELQDWDTFWLTDTPFDVSKYPDAGSYRIANTAHFVSTVTGGTVTIINTHLDDQSEQQRRLGASLILHRAKYEAISTRSPVIVTGDFNAPNGDGAYQIITGMMDSVPLNKSFTDKYSWEPTDEPEMTNFRLLDLLGETPAHQRSGHYATFTGFSSPSNFKKFDRIDYIFGGSNGGWTAQSYHVGENLRDDGIYASDHRPIVAHLNLRQTQEMTQQ